MGNEILEVRRINAEILPLHIQFPCLGGRVATGNWWLTSFGSVLKLKVGHLCKELAGKVEPVDLWPECQSSSIYCQFGSAERNFVFRLNMHGESENLRWDIPEVAPKWSA